MSTTEEIEATRRWLALEHEAVWTCGLIGARFPELAEAARSSMSAHRSTRDRLVTRVAALGGRPVGARPAYAVPDPADAAAGRALAQDVEARIAAACVRLVAVTQDRARDRAVDGLRDAATAQVAWGAAPEPFPGLD
ncbi:DUF4439 domain-containing protein [Aeromicrobium sp. 179-A 4D2 NHS]|uniref:DUF4439 domain-containing protein n=1 Tax=Aeromicrobium sp. 179-A 4D2 NHS TaxID=3142375 RepID=UPI0039A0AB38